MLTNTTNGNTFLDQWVGSLQGYQRGGPNDAAANEGACVLDLPGDLKNGGQEIGAPEGTAINRKGGQAGTPDLPESFKGRQVTVGQGSGRGHQSPYKLGLNQ